MPRPKRVEAKSELITRQTSIDNLRLVDNLIDPDRVLEKLGIDADYAFQDITNDDHLTSVMGTRMASVKGMEWDITVGKSDERIMQACQDMLDNLNRNHNGMGVARMIDDILQANPWGMSCLEVVWQTGINEWTPIKVEGRPFRYFTFNNANELKFLTADNISEGVPIPDKKVILSRHWITSQSFENPYGDKLLSKSYWPVTFKRNGLKWWNVFVEKYAMPWLIGRVKPSMSETDRDTLASNLAQAVQDGVLLISNDHELDTLDGNKKDSSDVYVALNKYMDASLSKIWLGETLTTEIGDVGSYAASKVHQGVKDERRDQDKLMVQTAFQTLIDWFVELNFGEQAETPEFKLIEPLGINLELANRDEVLSRTGLKFTSEYYQRKYGLEEDEFEITENTEPAIDPMAGEFSRASRDNAQSAVDAMTDSLTASELDAQMNGILKPVIELIQNGEDYNEVLKQLTKIFPDMNSEKYEAEILKAYNLADTIGRLGDARD